MGLQLRNKTPKRRVKEKLRSTAEVLAANDIWAMDFVHDQLATGRKIRVLTIVDTFTRSRRQSIRASYRGTMSWRPSNTSANSSAIPRRSASIKAPSSSSETSICGPTDESTRLLSARQTDRQCLHRIFNGKFRAECLNAHWSLSLDEARRKCEDWRRDYNEGVLTARSATKPR